MFFHMFLINQGSMPKSIHALSKGIKPCEVPLFEFGGDLAEPLPLPHIQGRLLNGLTLIIWQKISFVLAKPLKELKGARLAASSIVYSPLDRKARKARKCKGYKTVFRGTKGGKERKTIFHPPVPNYFDNNDGFNFYYSMPTQVIQAQFTEKYSLTKEKVPNIAQEQDTDNYCQLWSTKVLYPTNIK